MPLADRGVAASGGSVGTSEVTRVVAPTTIRGDAAQRALAHFVLARSFTRFMRAEFTTPPAHVPDTKARARYPLHSITWLPARRRAQSRAPCGELPQRQPMCDQMTTLLRASARAA